MHRRQLIIASLCTALAGAAFAQQQDADQTPDVSPVRGPEELWFLYTAMDSLIFILAVAVLKDSDVVLQARREFQPYSAQLVDPKAVDTINAALKSSEGQARVEEAKATIAAAAKEIGAFLGEGVVAPTLRSSITKSFVRASTLLAANAATNKSWWCRVYAFRKVSC